jgi:TrmH family RNA methyltransferase
MDRITSAKNPLVQQLRALRRGAAGDLMAVEGRVMILEALSCGLTPRYALLEEELPQRELAEALARAGARVYWAPRALLESVCATKTPQGSCCAFDMVPPRSPAGPRIVALDGVQDPGNVGAIWRTADAAGFGGILLGAGCAGPENPKVIRASMGSCFRLPYEKVPDLGARLEDLKASGMAVAVSALDGEDVYQRAPLGDAFVLVIGSEAHGASLDVKARATHRLRLPMRGGAESLNAAVAAGILMYELTR